MAIDSYARQLAMKALTQEAGKEEQTKSITITENGSTSVYPDEGKVLSSVNVNTNVPISGDISEYFKTSGLKQYTTNQFLWTQSVKKMPVLDISNLTELDFAFYYYKGEVPMLDTAHIVNFSSTFRYTTASTIPLWNTSKGTNFTYMFADSRIKDLPLIDTSSGEKFNYMFYRTTYLKTIPLLNTSKGITFNNMFEYSEIETIPLIDTSSGQSFERMFSSASELLEIPKFNTSNGINFNYMLYSSHKITSIPQLDTSKGQTFVQMMYGCGSLKEIPELDFSSAIDIRTCIATSPVENLGGFKNLGKAYTKTTENNSNYTLNLSYSNLLTYDSLMNVINNLYDLNLTYDVANGGTLYTQKLQLGTTNIAKLTAEEIAIATNKGWTVV